MEKEYRIMLAFAEETLGPGGSHGMGHVRRVVALCEAVGRIEGADMAILLPAAILHDIARPREKSQGIPHNVEGARIAAAYLRSIGYDGRRIGPVADAIRTHRYRSEETPESLEARILSDADKLDAMGAIGIARTFMRAAEHGGDIGDAVNHFHDKLLRLHNRMYTKTAARIAAGRHAFLVSFLAALEAEGTGTVLLPGDDTPAGREPEEPGQVY
jgi:uncharacterized protein